MKPRKQMLWYEYFSTCPKCKTSAKLYSLYEDAIAGDVQCLCGYKGLADLRLIGRKLCLVNGQITNPNIVDKS